MDKYLLFLGYIVLTLFAVLLACAVIECSLDVYRHILETTHISKLY